MLTDIIPTAWRQRVYAAYALAVVIVGAIQTGYATISHTSPSWLLIAWAVTAYLGGALGIMAASNPTPPKTGAAAVPVVPAPSVTANSNGTVTATDAAGVATTV